MGCSSSKPYTTQPYTAAARPTTRTAQSSTTKTTCAGLSKPQTRYSTPTRSSTTMNSTSDYGFYIGMGNADTTSYNHTHHHHHNHYDGGYSGGYDGGYSGGGGDSGGCGGGGDSGGGGGGGDSGGGGGGGGCD